MIEAILFKNRHGEHLDSSYHPGTREGRLVILGHGVTGNKDRPLLVKLAEELSARGWPCLRFSYAGNGNSGGDFRAATISKECEDLEDVIGQLPAGTKIAFVGHSMSGAVGVRTSARETRILMLVTLAGMIHTADFAEREFGELIPGEGCMWDDPGCPLSQEFMADMRGIGDVLGDVAQLRIPYVLLHGGADDVVPLGDSEQAVAAATMRSKELIQFPAAGHSFEEVSAAELADSFEIYLESAL